MNFENVTLVPSFSVSDGEWITEALPPLYHFTSGRAWKTAFPARVWERVKKIIFIPQISNALLGFVPQPNLQWYLDYEDVRDAVFLEEREIVRVPRTQPEKEEDTLQNRYRPLQEELEKLKEKKTPPQNP